MMMEPTLLYYCRMDEEVPLYCLSFELKSKVSRVMLVEDQCRSLQGIGIFIAESCWDNPLPFFFNPFH
jgi:hypothetical protein